MKTARKSFALFYQHTINSGFIRPTLSHPFNIVLSWNIIIFFCSCCRARAFQIYIYFAVLYEHIKLCSSRPRCLRGAASETFRLHRSRWRIFLLFLLETFSVDFFPVPGSFMGRVRDMKTRKLCLAQVFDFFFAFARRRCFTRITSCSHVVSEFWLLIKYANFSAFKLARSQVPSRLLIAFDNPAAHGELIRNVYRSGWF